MATRSFLPTTDLGLLSWAIQFKTAAAELGAAIGVTSVQLAAFTTLINTYQTDLAACDRNVRNMVATQTKNASRDALIANARMLAKGVDGTPGVSDAQRRQLALTVRVGPSPIPVPKDQPEIDVRSVSGRIVQLRIHAPTGSRRGKPTGVARAFVFAYVGPHDPGIESAYTFMGSTTRTDFTVQFPDTVPGGSCVWFRACWANPRDQTGPSSSATPVYLQGAAAVSEVGLKLTNDARAKTA